MFRKLKWQIPEGPLSARHNWFQGPVLGRGPAVEKHWFRLSEQETDVSCSTWGIKSRFHCFSACFLFQYQLSWTFSGIQRTPEAGESNQFLNGVLTCDFFFYSSRRRPCTPYLCGHCHMGAIITKLWLHTGIKLYRQLHFNWKSNSTNSTLSCHIQNQR
jgi:hypothetical protein